MNGTASSCCVARDTSGSGSLGSGPTEPKDIDHDHFTRTSHPGSARQPARFGQCEKRDDPRRNLRLAQRGQRELKRYLPWTGTSNGPEAIVRTFEGIGRAWETKAFEVRDVIEQGDKVAMFGSFTYRGRQSGQEITSPFALLAKVKDGKIHFVQF